jgi:hypothetical protein
MDPLLIGPAGDLPRNLIEACNGGWGDVCAKYAEVLRPFDSPDAGGKIGTEQAGISRFICEPRDCRESTVNCDRRKLT